MNLGKIRLLLGGGDAESALLRTAFAFLAAGLRVGDSAMTIAFLHERFSVERGPVWEAAPMSGFGVDVGGPRNGTSRARRFGRIAIPQRGALASKP